MNENLQKICEHQTEDIPVDPEVMREFIIETAQELQNIRLLKTLYIRAKTLRNM